MSTITHKGSFSYCRATHPLSSPQLFRAGKTRFGVMHGTTLVPCQGERHQLGNEPGTVDSVELIFPTIPGHTSYDIVETGPLPEGRCKAGRFAEGWIQHAPVFLFNDSIVASTYDVTDAQIGPWLRKRRFYAEHFAGFVTVFHGLNVVLVEMLFHDCEPKSCDLFFTDLLIPGTVSMVHAWPEPNTHAAYLIERRADGKLNCLERKGRRSFRFVVHDGSQDALATSLAAAGDWGVSDSWQSQKSYQAQAQRAPDLSTIATTLGNRAAADNSALNLAILNGTQIGTGANTGQPGGRVGFKSLWGGPYGGTTSGGYRYQWEGEEALASARHECVQELQTRAMMVDNRMSVLILDDTGRVAEMEDWIDQLGPKGGWEMAGDSLIFERNGNKIDDRDGAFGFSKAVASVDTALIPDSLAQLSTYVSGNWRPMDDQHFDRAYMPHVALAWLRNDPISKLTLLGYAELWRMTLLQNGFQGQCAMIAANPGHGCDWGRLEAHMFSMAAQAYRFMPARLRAHWKPLFKKFAGALCQAQMVENGLFEARIRKENTDPGNNAYVPLGSGAHRVAKVTEECLLVNALRAVAGCGALDALDVQEIDATIAAFVEIGLWGFLWRSGAEGAAPVDYAAVCPMGGGMPYTSWLGKGSYGHDIEECGAAIGYALEIAKPVVGSELQACVFKYAGNATSYTQARNYLLQKKANQLDDSFPLVAALEGM